MAAAATWFGRAEMSALATNTHDVKTRTMGQNVLGGQKRRQQSRKHVSTPAAPSHWHTERVYAPHSCDPAAYTERLRTTGEAVGTERSELQSSSWPRVPHSVTIDNVLPTNFTINHNCDLQLRIIEIKVK